MRIGATATSIASLLVLSQVITAAAPDPQCQKQNACYKAVRSNALCPLSERKPGCASFLMKTVTPKPRTRIVVTHVTKTVTPTTTETTMPGVEETTTTTSTQTVPRTVRLTQTVTTTATETDTTPTTITNTESRTETETRTLSTTTTTTTTPINEKRKREASTECPVIPPESPSTLPRYASKCSNTVAYSSACSCYGVKPSFKTLRPCTVVLTRTSTVKSTADAVTTTVTSRTTGLVTITDQETVTTPTTIETEVTETSTFSETVASTVTASATVTTTTTTRTTEVTTATETAKIPLRCPEYGFLVQQTALYRVDLNNAQTVLITSQVSGAQLVNAMGYNVLDNFLYALRQDGAILRIGADGESSSVANVGFFYNSGVVDTSGYYWVSRSGQQWDKIDLIPDSDTYGQVLAQNTSDSKGYNIIDWVYLPTQPDYLYAVASADTQTALLRWSMTTHVWDVLKQYTTTEVPFGAWGAAYGTSDTTIYASENNGGDIYSFDTDTYAAVFVAKGPASNLNDGARCVYFGID